MLLVCGTNKEAIKLPAMASKGLASSVASLESEIHRLRYFLERGNSNTVVLTGAGISTDSGIPDYRGPNGVYRRNRDFKPIQYQQFVQQHEYRQRYWARSLLGWPKFSMTKPNLAHKSLTYLQKQGIVSSIITQNVDRLHTKSGSTNVCELHGALHEVECIACHHNIQRDFFQELLLELNPNMEIWMEKNIQEDAGDVSSSEDRVNPDGDVEFTDYKHFHYPSCPQCGNIMKPHVIFFGENMTKHVRQRSAEIVDDAQALLVIGSSLQVYSALRLVNQAHLKKIHIGIINFGPTRADLLCQERFQNGCTELLDGVQLELVQANSLVVTEL